MTAIGPGNIIIGTAGHVDHGKTALVQRLTGIDTDRFQEEKKRGLTIDLGFAWLPLPGGSWAGIVDVPGHERFVKNMLAGATGIDIFMLVVAADEGVMPQTREHLTILDVLQIDTGLVVVTKCDLVDAEMLLLAQEDIAQQLRGTVFERAPIVTVSARTGEGIDGLVACLDELARQVRPRDTAGPTRMQIDRSFSIKGFGTVVTGSLIRGGLKVDQELEILPTGHRTRVRNLEVYEQHLDEVLAPVRVGGNIAGLGRDEVERGHQLVAPGSMKPSWMLDVRLRLSPSAGGPLRYRERVRIHHGAAELLGRVVLLETEALGPGEEGLAQLRLEAPAVAGIGDHFVLRRYSPAFTIGGGTVLDPTPSRHRRKQEAAIRRLQALQEGTLADRGADWARSHSGGFTAADLAAALQIDDEVAERAIEELLARGTLAPMVAGRYMHAEVAGGLRRAALDALAGYHAQNPLQPAAPKAFVQAALGQLAPDVAQWLMATLEAGEEIVSEPGSWRLAGHRVALAPEDQAALDRLLERVATAGVTAPSREEVLELLGRKSAHALLDIALRRGDLMVVGGFLMSPAALLAAAKSLAERYEAHGPFTIGEAREVLGASRKYLVPVLEYLDGTGFTRREGEARRVLRAPGPKEGAADGD